MVKRMEFKKVWEWVVFWICVCVFVISGVGLLNLGIVAISLNHDYVYKSGETEAIVKITKNDGGKDYDLSHQVYYSGEPNKDESTTKTVELEDGKIFEITVVDGVKTKKLYGSYTLEVITISETGEQFICSSTRGLRIALTVITIISFLTSVGFFIFINISKAREPIKGIDKKNVE